MNLPNRLTLARILLALIFIALMSFENIFCYLLAYLVFMAAAITDYYDGKIARAQNIITNFGKLLDPVADKVLLAAGFVMMIKLDGLWVPGWAVVVVLAREFLVTGARLLAAADGLVIAADRWGKLKTVFQMVYVFTFMVFAIAMLALKEWCAVYGSTPEPVMWFKTGLEWSSMIAMVLVAGYTAWSGWEFLRANRAALNLH